MADAMKQTPMYTSYVAVALHPEDFPKLLDCMDALMRTPYDWSGHRSAMIEFSVHCDLTDVL